MIKYDLIKKLCKQHGITVTGMEKELGFSRGSLCKIETSKPSMDKVQKIANFFNVSVEYLLSGGNIEHSDRYYLDEETAQIAQEIFENKELRMLFSAARDSSPEDLKTTHEMLMALKRKERGVDD